MQCLIHTWLCLRRGSVKFGSLKFAVDVGIQTRVWIYIPDANLLFGTLSNFDLLAEQFAYFKVTIPWLATIWVMEILGCSEMSEISPEVSLQRINLQALVRLHCLHAYRVTSRSLYTHFRTLRLHCTKIYMLKHLHIKIILLKIWRAVAALFLTQEAVIHRDRCCKGPKNKHQSKHPILVSREPSEKHLLRHLWPLCWGSYTIHRARICVKVKDFLQIGNNQD